VSEFLCTEIPLLEGVQQSKKTYNFKKISNQKVQQRVQQTKSSANKQNSRILKKNSREIALSEALPMSGFQNFAAGAAIKIKIGFCKNSKSVFVKNQNRFLIYSLITESIRGQRI